MYKYSMILPCYNVATYLKKCLSSIFSNNVAEVELILVDDGSRDNFQQCVESFFGIQLDFAGGAE